jgi:hypothetical protein
MKLHQGLRNTGIALLAMLALFATTAVRAQTCGSTTVPFTAGADIPAGTVTLSNDAANFYLTINLAPGVAFVGGQTNFKAWVGTDAANIPAWSDGFPNLDAFPFSASIPETQTSQTISVPYTDLLVQDTTQVCNLAVIAAAAARVVIDGQVQIAWAGSQFVRINEYHWYWYAVHHTCCEQGPPPVEGCETAFGKGGYVFTTNSKSNPEGLPTLALSNNRWGWAFNLAYPQNVVAPVWSGAGQNYTSKGSLVGNVRISWDGANATVTYNATSGDFKEIHVYAGDSRPTTLAPGQYGHTAYLGNGSTTYSVSKAVSDTNGDGIWVIAHAVSCR